MAIDLHFHALPGVDDGPPDLEAAVELARAAVAAGIEAVVATPHVSWEWPANTPQTIAEALGLLQRELASRQIPLRVLPGAEVALLRAFDLPDDELRGLGLGGGPWILVEAPHSRGVTAVESMLAALAQRGHRILLAHVERCPAFVEDAGLLTRLVGAGMLASVTAGSLVGRFGREARGAAERFLAAGLVHNVSSDAHDCDARAPRLVRDLDDAGLAAQAPWLATLVPAAILSGSALPPAPPWPSRRRLRWPRA